MATSSRTLPNVRRASKAPTVRSSAPTLSRCSGCAPIAQLSQAVALLSRSRVSLRLARQRSEEKNGLLALNEVSEAGELLVPLSG